MHFRHFVYIAVNAVCSEIARCPPNFAYVTARDGGERRGRAERHAFERLGQARFHKTMHAVKPHEEVRYLELDHPLNRLFRHPNDVDVTCNLLYELTLFLELTGNSYLWKIPNRLGFPVEAFVLPAHWVWPRVGTNEWVQYYEIRPWVGPGVFHLPPDEVIHFRYPSPIHKLDGWSKQTAGAEWIDVAESVDRCRYYQFKNGCFPMGWLELGTDYDPTDQDIERIYAKFFNRAQGEWNYGRPIITPPGSKYNPLMISPMEMAYIESADQLRDWVLALFRVPKEVAGIQDAGSEIAMYGPMTQFCRFAIAPIYQLLGEVLTKDLCSIYDPRIRCWWDDPTPDNPEQKRADIKLQFDTGAITTNEIRAEYGREAYAHGGDDPLVNMGVSPMPINTGEDLGELGLTPADTARYLTEQPDPQINEDGEAEQPPPVGKPKPGAKYWARGSYFEDCPRDEEGHCKPSGEGGGGGAEQSSSSQKPAAQAVAAHADAARSALRRKVEALNHLTGPERKEALLKAASDVKKTLRDDLQSDLKGRMPEALGAIRKETGLPDKQVARLEKGLPSLTKAIADRYEEDVRDVVRLAAKPLSDVELERVFAQGFHAPKALHETFMADAFDGPLTQIRAWQEDKFWSKFSEGHEPTDGQIEEMRRHIDNTSQTITRLLAEHLGTGLETSKPKKRFRKSSRKRKVVYRPSLNGHRKKP